MTVSFHVQFERAEMTNDVNWFDAFYDKNKIFLDTHLFITDGVFTWENFKEWKRAAYDEKGRAYKALLYIRDEHEQPLWKRCGCGEDCDNIPKGLTRTMGRDTSLEEEMDIAYNL